MALVPSAIPAAPAVDFVVGARAQRHDELFTLWAAARAEANLAYDEWCVSPGRTGYAAYRAAEDRADVAQDLLAVAPH